MVRVEVICVVEDVKARLLGLKLQEMISRLAVGMNAGLTDLQVAESVVARDGIEPPTPAFQGCRTIQLSGPESADVIEGKAFMLGRF